MLVRGVALMLTPVFTFARLIFAGRFALLLRLLLPLALALSLVFLGLGRFGRFSVGLEFVFRFSVGSSGVTVSGDSPSLAARLISIATVCPVLTTSPARGNWNITVSGLASLLGLVARTRNFRSASPKIFSASNRSLPTTSGTFTSGLRKER